MELRLTFVIDIQSLGISFLTSVRLSERVPVSPFALNARPSRRTQNSLPLPHRLA
jgi:hypothetical protein